jgi:putative transport protein
MVRLLVDNPLLLLFVVAAIGYPLGRIKVGGTSLGVAAVLFVGLAVGALDADLRLPEIIYQIGLVLFVYTIGLSSGSLFFASLRRKGWRDNALVAGMLVLAALLVLAAHSLLNIKATLAAGMFTGSLTNTPALAQVLDQLKFTLSPDLYEQLRADPVIAYSLTYPMGVVGMILVILVMQRVWKINYPAETQRLDEFRAGSEPLANRTICITRPDVAGKSIQELMHQHRWNVIFGRYRRDGEVTLASGRTCLERGDEVNLIGAEHDLDEVMAYLGENCGAHLEQDLSTFDKRRIFVSSLQVAGKRLRDLELYDRYGAVVTRLRRGDVELLPHGDTRLSLGDQVRVVARPDQMEALAVLFGDSYRKVSEIDVLSFSLGMALGLLLGLAPIPLPNGLSLKLGIAGGPLIAALVLGAAGRTGSMVWDLPYSANLTLRQVGLILFLAGVGTRSGYNFVSTFSTGGGLAIFLAGMLVTLLVSLCMLFIGYRLLKIPMGLLVGMLAGMQTQPAVLSFALEQTHNDLPNVGYATVYPVATIAKILLAQLILTLLMR